MGFTRKVRGINDLWCTMHVHGLNGHIYNFKVDLTDNLLTIQPLYKIALIRKLYCTIRSIEFQITTTGVKHDIKHFIWLSYIYLSIREIVSRMILKNYSEFFYNLVS